MGMSRSVRSCACASPWRKVRAAIETDAHDDPERLEDAEDAGGGDRPHADVADVAPEDLRRRHLGDGDGGRVDRLGHPAADHPDDRHQDEVREEAARAEDEGRAEAHDVAEAEDEGHRVEAHDHLRPLGERPHDGEELEVHELVPDVEGGGEEVVDAGDPRGLEQQLRLRAALLAGHQHLGDRGGLGVGELPVGLPHEVAAKGDEEERAEAAAGQADEDGLQGVGVELQDVEGGEREDRPRGERSRDAAHPGDDHVLEERGAAAVGPGEADGEDGDRDGRLHHLAHLQARVGRGHREDDAEEEPPAHRADRGLGHGGRGRDDGPVRLAGGERQVGVRGEGSGVGSVHSASGARAGRASLFGSPGGFQGGASGHRIRGGSRV